jgi:hypothetical protein
MITVSQLIKFLSKQDPNRIVLIKDRYEYVSIDINNPKLVLWDTLIGDIVNDTQNIHNRSSDKFPSIVLQPTDTDDIQ